MYIDSKSERVKVWNLTIWAQTLSLLETKSNQPQSNKIKCWSLGRGDKWSTWRKTSQSRVGNQQTQPTYDAGSRNWTWATLILLEGELSHRCAIPALHKDLHKHDKSHMYSDHFIAVLVQCRTCPVLVPSAHAHMVQERTLVFWRQW